MQHCDDTSIYARVVSRRSSWGCRGYTVARNKGMTSKNRRELKQKIPTGYYVVEEGFCLPLVRNTVSKH